ncbi:MAG TPA: hypothetical protein PK967_05955 [Candidatus Hydrogenedentes bacterium]|nr:hypothetical protein [Candidatus Hydrogenedentota bacterium]
MIHAPNMLMIGSCGRNSGKTTFACELLKRLSAQHEIVAAKVTTIQERNGTCPRGGEGCGVCATLDGRFCITEETLRGGTKDTQRLLAAGAARVFWLRVMSEHLEEGAQAFIETIGARCPIVCESNSLRTKVEPAFFLLFRGSGDKTIKASAGAVQQYADRLVVFDGTRFDLDPAHVAIMGNRWTIGGEAITCKPSTTGEI